MVNIYLILEPENWYKYIYNLYIRSIRVVSLHVVLNESN